MQEDSDAVIGHILLCGSLIRSNKLDSGTDNDLAKCVQLLTAASHHKIVHSSLAFTFLIELLSKVSDTSARIQSPGFYDRSNFVFFCIILANTRTLQVSSVANNSERPKASMGTTEHQHCSFSNGSSWQVSRTARC